MDTPRERIFTELTTGHEETLLSVISAYAPSAADREGLAKEITAALWRSIPSYSDDRNSAEWVLRVANFAAIEWTLETKLRNDRNAGQEPRSESTRVDPADVTTWSEYARREVEARARSVDMVALNFGAIFALLGAFSLTYAIAEQAPWYCHVSSLITLGVVPFMVWCRRQRPKFRFEAPWPQYLDERIAHVERCVAGVRAFAWLFLLPVTALLLIAMRDSHSGLFQELCLAHFFSLLVLFAFLRIALREQFLPKFRMLSDLRRKLASGRTGAT